MTQHEVPVELIIPDFGSIHLTKFFLSIWILGKWLSEGTGHLIRQSITLTVPDFVVPILSVLG